METFRNLNRSQWLSIIIVALLTGTFVVFDGLRALGPVAGVEPLRLVNIGFTLTMAISGPLMWARRSPRFRRWSWLQHSALEWTHRLVGLSYLPLILLWDFYYETGDEGGAEMAVLEAINKPVLIALLISAALLFLKRPRLLMRHYSALKYFHIVAASVYVVKFFVEPLLGGKLG
ncbi:MAG: hypothetical protein QFE16_11070 [Pseudomonadota bacterium]|nr:hypothetical protein [Pseudomonadota bacterium]